MYFACVLRMRGAPELVMHKRCPLNSFSGGGPGRCDNVHAGSNVIRPDRAQDYPSPRLPTALPSQTLVKSQSIHVVAKYKESQIPQVRTPDFNDRVAMSPLPR